MTTAVEALPDDPDMLKAMLLAERAESERLRQIIKELQRHRFGRRAETLPQEQLQLGLEDVTNVRLCHRDVQASEILHGWASSSYDGADPIGLRGRATAHYPMLKK